MTREEQRTFHSLVVALVSVDCPWFEQLTTFLAWRGQTGGAR